MSAVSIRKKVNQNQAVMKPHCDLVGGISVVFNPEVCISEQCDQHFSHLRNWNPDGFFGLAKVARPLPCLIKHPVVKFSDVFIREGSGSLDIPPGESPSPPSQDGLALPLIQFFPGGQVGNQVTQFLWCERRVPVPNI